MGAPPTPILGEPYGVRLVDAAADAEMVSEWMNRPHLVESWEYAWPPERLAALPAGPTGRRILLALHRQFPRPAVRLRRALPGSEGLHRSRYDADPYDIGLHAAIAEMRFVNRGIAPIMLPRLVTNIFDLEPRCRRIMFDPGTATPEREQSANTPVVFSSESTTCRIGEWRCTRCRVRRRTPGMG